jgi:hypothetical protein
MRPHDRSGRGAGWRTLGIARRPLRPWPSQRPWRRLRWRKHNGFPPGPSMQNGDGIGARRYQLSDLAEDPVAARRLAGRSVATAKPACQEPDAEDRRQRGQRPRFGLLDQRVGGLRRAISLAGSLLLWVAELRMASLPGLLDSSRWTPGGEGGSPRRGGQKRSVGSRSAGSSDRRTYCARMCIRAWWTS